MHSHDSPSFVQTTFCLNQIDILVIERHLLNISLLNKTSIWCDCSKFLFSRHENSLKPGLFMQVIDHCFYVFRQKSKDFIIIQINLYCQMKGPRYISSSWWNKNSVSYKSIVCILILKNNQTVQDDKHISRNAKQAPGKIRMWKRVKSLNTQGRCRWRLFCKLHRKPKKGGKVRKCCLLFA